MAKIELSFMAKPKLPKDPHKLAKRCASAGVDFGTEKERAIREGKNYKGIIRLLSSGRTVEACVVEDWDEILRSIEKNRRNPMKVEQELNKIKV